MVEAVVVLLVIQCTLSTAYRGRLDRQRGVEQLGCRKKRWRVRAAEVEDDISRTTERGRAARRESERTDKILR